MSISQASTPSSVAWQAENGEPAGEAEVVAGGVREHQLVAPVDALLALLEPTQDGEGLEREQARHRLRRHRVEATALLAGVLGDPARAESAMTTLIEESSVPLLTSQQLRKLQETYDQVVSLAHAEY